MAEHQQIDVFIHDRRAQFVNEAAAPDNHFRDRVIDVLRGGFQLFADLLFERHAVVAALRKRFRRRRFDADEARRIGVVNRVVPHDELDAATADLAGTLAAKSPLLMQLGKDALWRQGDMPLEDAWDYLRSQLALAFSTEDIQEGVAAFKAGRDPVWRGR